MQIIPIFPLKTVLFPGGFLPLRILEPHYVDMAVDCINNAKPFGICLIEDGVNINSEPNIMSVGTLAKIVDWKNLNSCLLGVWALGTSKFTVERSWYEDGQVIKAEVSVHHGEANLSVVERYASLVSFLDSVVNKTYINTTPSPPVINFESANELGFRLSEVLPLPSYVQQDLLELCHPFDRLDRIYKLMDEMEFTISA